MCKFCLKGNATCDKSSHPCGKEGCFPEARVCNGIRDCPGGEDEIDCGRLFNSFKSRLKHTHTILVSFVCKDTVDIWDQQANDSEYNQYVAMRRNTRQRAETEVVSQRGWNVTKFQTAMTSSPVTFGMDWHVSTEAVSLHSKNVTEYKTANTENTADYSSRLLLLKLSVC